MRTLIKILIVLFLVFLTILVLLALTQWFVSGYSVFASELDWQYLPLVQGGNTYANPIPDVTPAPIPIPRPPPNYCPPENWDGSAAGCEQPEFTGDFDRIITERADHFTWCELQGLECYVGEVDPEAVFIYPEGWTVTGIVYFVMTDPEHQLGTYYIFTKHGGCKDGYCAEIDGNTARIWRDLTTTILTIDAVDLWREKGP